MNAVLRYPGAKNRIADWITSYFPKHTVYLEPFCGSASVLMEKLIKKFDVPGALIYIDPPYPHGTRKNYLYKYEMEDSDHINLLETINACKNANIIISGYECNLYDECLRGWNKQIKNTRAEAGQSRKEVLWMNYLQEMRIEEIMEEIDDSEPPGLQGNAKLQILQVGR